MKHLLLFIFCFLGLMVGYSQPTGVKPNYTTPYFQGNVVVKDTLGVQSRLLVNGTSGGKLGVNTTNPQFNFVSVCNRTTFGLNGLNVVNSDLNKNRSSVAQASDTSSLNLSFTASTGKPSFNIVGNTGVKYFEVDTVGDSKFGGNVNPSATSLYTLGTSALRWNALYLPTSATTGVEFTAGSYVREAAVSILAINTPTQINFRTGGGNRFIISQNAFVSATDNIRDLGSTTAYFANTYSNSFISNAGAGRTWKVLESDNATIGANLTINAGGGTAGGTANLNGGMLSLNPGQSKSQGFASVRLGSNTRASASGTVLNTIVDRIIIPSEFNLADAGNNDLFEVALNAGQQTGGQIQFTITCSDGTDHQSVSGMVTYDVVDKAGTLTVKINEIYANTLSASAGTLTRTWSVVDGANKITIRLEPNSSLVPTSMKMTICIFNGGQTAVTQL